MTKGWQRKEFTTKGADPTVMVTWRNDELRIFIEEFQAVYRTTRDDDTAAPGTVMDVLGEELHKALEEVYNMGEEERDARLLRGGEDLEGGL